MLTIPNAPAAELDRSPAARVVGQMAARSGLLLSHFEHRHHLALPDVWVPQDRPDLQGDPRWEGGRLVEHKYRHFRYENPIGSFHPGHRAKWTTHELCHVLVGFAWAPGATPFFQSLAARLAEVVPVALWYFFDEDGLQRCARHAGGGPLFKTWCADCDRAAETGDGPRDASWLARGRAFVDGELAAVQQSKRLGRSVGHRFATLDLESDALAHTAAHRLRMQSPEFRRYLDLFHGPEMGCWDGLDALAERALAVTEALCGGAPAPDLTAGRARYIAQDLGWRLMQVQMDCGGDVVDALDRIIEGLAAAPDDVDIAVSNYQTLCDDYFLPAAADVFAVGYPLGEYGVCLDQMLAGVEASLPESVLLVDDLPQAVAEFAATEAPRRAPIARRFAEYLVGKAPEAVSDVARYEAALGDPGPADREGDAFMEWPDPTAPLRVAEGLEVLQFSVDPRAIIAAMALDTEPSVDAVDTTLVLRRTGADLLVAEISDAARVALETLEITGAQSAAKLGLSDDELTALFELGVLLPARSALQRA